MCGEALFVVSQPLLKFGLLHTAKHLDIALASVLPRRSARPAQLNWPDDVPHLSALDAVGCGGSSLSNACRQQQQQQCSTYDTGREACHTIAC